MAQLVFWRTTVSDRYAASASIKRDRTRCPTAAADRSQRPAYYNKSRTHLSLGKDPPEPRAVQGADAGEIVAIREVGGLHHRYERRMVAQKRSDGIFGRHKGPRPEIWCYKGDRTGKIGGSKRERTATYGVRSRRPAVGGLHVQDPLPLLGRRGSRR